MKLVNETVNAGRILHNLKLYSTSNKFLNLRVYHLPLWDDECYCISGDGTLSKLFLQRRIHTIKSGLQIVLQSTGAKSIWTQKQQCLSFEFSLSNSMFFNCVAP